MKKIKIANRTIGDGQPCFIIAEIGSNHNGDLATAKKMIDAAVASGAEAVKFQLFTEHGLSSESHIQKILKKFEFQNEWLPILKEYSRRRGVIFFATPFDEDAVGVLAGAGVEVYKIASGDLTNLPLLKAVAKIKKPIILSVGVGTLAEIKTSLDVIYKAGNRNVALLHCIATYPTPVEEANLKIVQTLKEKFNVPVGFSDHTMDTIAPAVSVALGGCIVEKHFTISRKMKGPDHPIALEPAEFRKMADQIRETEKALGSAEKRIMPSEKGVLVTGRRSLYARRPVAKGALLSKDDLILLRPAKGIPPAETDLVVGKRLKRDLEAFEIIRWKDLAAK